MTVFTLAVFLFTCSCSVHHVLVQASMEAAEIDANGNIVATADDDVTNSNENNGERGAIFAELFRGRTNNNIDWTSTSAALEDAMAAVSNFANNILSSINLASIAADTNQERGEDATHREIASLDKILSMAHNMAEEASAKNPQRSIPQLVEHFKTHFQQSKAMLTEAFAHVDFTRLTLASLWYYAEHTESQKTPSWKRRMHRFHKPVGIDTILDLHDALYLMQVAYLPRKDQIEEDIGTNFRNGMYEVVYAVTTGHPTEPAHFIMIPKVEEAIANDLNKLDNVGGDGGNHDKINIGTFQGNNESTHKNKAPSALEIVIAIRGSGDVGDFVSDSMMNATSYRSGKAHDGLAKSGKYIVNLLIESIRKLWKESGREKVKVILVGYSLGAGVAAIAAMELNDYDFIDAQAITFGCPALLDLEQSEGTKDYITSVISDGDIISRMSGPTIANMFLDVMSHDWTDKAMLDLEHSLDHHNAFKTPLLQLDKDAILKWAKDTLAKRYRPSFAKISKGRMERELYPPGTCIHLWRDGVGHSATYTPCAHEVFGEVEFSRSLIDDHLLESGYHPALLSVAREARGDWNFDFDHDLMGLGAL